MIIGEYESLMEGHTFTAETGSLVYVPKGALHAHTTRLVSSTLV
jgi:ethanolamine utilization protein EutQ (cupin superfamily)